MEAYQERVVEEKKDLDGKIERLDTFLLSDKFGELPIDEQQRMRWQKSLMELYSDVLEDRIVNFPK
jgi:hypothetical protein